MSTHPSTQKAIAAATAAPRRPCVICGRPGRTAPITIRHNATPAHCSGRCLEEIRHRAAKGTASWPS